MHACIYLGLVLVVFYRYHTEREREGLGCMSNFNLENFDMIY